VRADTARRRARETPGAAVTAPSPAPRAVGSSETTASDSRWTSRGAVLGYAGTAVVLAAAALTALEVRRRASRR
jgi:hypothetical protein